MTAAVLELSTLAPSSFCYDFRRVFSRCRALATAAVGASPFLAIYSVYFYLQVKVYFQYETIGFTLCVAQRSSVECIIHEFQTRQRQKQQIGWF